MADILFFFLGEFWTNNFFQMRTISYHNYSVNLEQTILSRHIFQSSAGSLYSTLIKMCLGKRCLEWFKGEKMCFDTSNITNMDGSFFWLMTFFVSSFVFWLIIFINYLLITSVFMKRAFITSISYSFYIE
jgi:hypothetical protein